MVQPTRSEVVGTEFYCATGDDFIAQALQFCLYIKRNFTQILFHGILETGIGPSRYIIRKSSIFELMFDVKERDAASDTPSFSNERPPQPNGKRLRRFFERPRSLSHRPASMVSATDCAAWSWLKWRSLSSRS